MQTLRTIVFLSMFWCLTGWSSLVSAHSGHTVWGAWRFDWEVSNNAGIAIKNVYFNNEFVIWRASMPVIRVQYFNCPNCGPYADQLNWNNLLNISDCGNNKVCQRSFISSDGHNWLELGVLAGIGKYRIYQVWYLSDNGTISLHMWSKGLHHNADHNHHAYWRMDFDINGSGSDQVFVFDKSRSDEGWGPGWHKHTIEQNDLKYPPTNRSWFVRDNPTGHGVWILPGPDGSSDGFSTKDVAPRLYHGLEGEPWAVGAWGHLGFHNNEDIQEKDIVLWYVAHLHHIAAEGADQWHWAGPVLHIAR